MTAAQLQRRRVARAETPKSPDARPLTRNEIAVLAHLKSAARPMKAYELLEDLRTHGLKAPMTIYRALDQLMRRRLVRKIVSVNAFLAIDPNGPRAGAYVICRVCGSTTERRLGARQIETLFSTLDAEIDEVFIEAYGACPEGGCAGVQS